MHNTAFSSDLNVVLDLFILRASGVSWVSVCRELVCVPVRTDTIAGVEKTHVCPPQIGFPYPIEHTVH